MPYPVGVVSVANFSESRGRYRPIARRRIAVAFVGAAIKTKLRYFLRLQFNSTGGTVSNEKSYRCAPGHESKNCGLPNTTVYRLVANSDFCLEPTGDTPTRSHFYLAVLAGCIPVIFDFDRGNQLRHTRSSGG